MACKRDVAYKRLCVLVMSVVLCLLLVVALAAGILSLVILFTGFVDTAVCKCASGESPDMHVMCMCIMLLCFSLHACDSTHVHMAT